MKNFTSVLKWTGKIAGLMLGLLLALLVLVLLWPTLVLNETTLSWGRDQVNRRVDTLELGWSAISVDWQISGFLARRIRIEIDDLRAEALDTGSTWQDRSVITFAYDLRRIIPRLREIGPLILSRGETAFDYVTEEEAERQVGDKGSPVAEDFALPAWMHWAAIQEVLIHEQDWHVTVDGRPTHGTFFFHAEPNSSGEIHVNSRLSHQMGEDGFHHKGRVDIDARGRQRSLLAPWQVNLHSRLESPRLGEMDHRLRLDITETENGYELLTYWEHPDMRLNSQATGGWTRSSVFGEISAWLQPMRAVGTLENLALELRDCGFRWKVEASQATQRFHLDCPMALAPFTVTRDTASLRTVDESPTRIFAIRLGAEVAAVAPYDASVPMDVTLQAGPASLWDSVIQTQGTAQAVFELIPEAPASWRNVSIDSDLEISSEQFQELVQLLESTPWAIPAPLHPLRGSVAVSLKSDSQESPMRIDSRLRTQLSSQHQRMNVDVRAKIHPAIPSSTEAPPENHRTQVDADVLLREVRLSLPPLTAGIPPVGPDARIRPNLQDVPREESETDSVDYSVRVKTPEGQPVMILAPIAEEPVPISVDLRFSNRRPTLGEIEIGDAPLKVGGIEREFEGGRIVFRLSELKTEARGQVQSVEGEVIEMPLAEMSGLVSPMPSPKPPLALAQMVTSLLLGESIDVAVVSQSPESQGGEQEKEPVTVDFQIRY